MKRAYEPAEPDDGTRVLVDRLWPRGVSKSASNLDEWLKDVAPSPALRKAWHADPEGHTEDHFQAFAADYREELKREPAKTALQTLGKLARQTDRLTLVYGARNTEINHAVVLRDALLEQLNDPTTRQSK